MDTALLKRISLFEGLNSPQLARVAAITAERQYQAGDRIFKEGEKGDDFFLILEGRVRISKMLAGIGEEALAILDAGSYFGEMAMVDNTPRSADAIAHSSCSLGIIQCEALESLMFTDKDIAYTVLWTFVRTLAVRLRDTNEKI
jgi:CRP/FNR family cyclic AMP-dependent transcriptional regulator